MNQKVQEVIDTLDGKIVLTQEEIEKFRTAVHRTYQVIGSDANLENAPLNEILEVVLDADYVDSYGGLTKEEYKKLDKWVHQEIKKYQEQKLGWKATMNRIAKVIW
jgi:hypothetical protein